MQRTRHAVAVAATLAVLATGGLTSCTTADDVAPSAAASATGSPAPAATPAPPPAEALPEVPVRSSDLDDLAGSAAVPPASLRITSLGVDLPVDPVGVTDDGQMEIPPLAERGGWYRYGASPSDDAGTAVVAAHVDSVASAGVGPFARLKDVERGARVVVRLEDGSERTYRVTDVVAVAKPEARWSRVFTRGGAHRLVLVTCGGTFQREVRSYSDNVIVTAEPVGG